MTENATGVMYLVVRQDHRNPTKLIGSKVTSRYPTVVDVDEVIVKLQVNVPMAAFRPYLASVTVDPLQTQQTVKVEQA